MDTLIPFIAYRMLIVLGGILCIYFGYRLFYISKVNQGELKIKTGQNYELSLRDVAPGVFFALFGAGILIFCTANGITIKDFESDLRRSQTSIGESSAKRQGAAASGTPIPAPAEGKTSVRCISQRIGEC